MASRSGSEVSGGSVMSDTFAITVAFFVLTSIVAAFVRRRARDRCLMSFSGDAVVLETAEKVISGRLTVENTGWNSSIRPYA